MKMTKKIAAILMAALMLCCAFASAASAAAPSTRYVYKATVSATDRAHAGYNGWAKVRYYYTYTDMMNETNSYMWKDIRFKEGKAEIGYLDHGVGFNRPRTIWYRFDEVRGVTFYRDENGMIASPFGKITPYRID